MHGYNDESIRMNLLVSVNKLTPLEMLTGSVRASKIKLDEIQAIDLFRSSMDFPHPQRLIEDLNLPGFNRLVWNSISTENAHKQGQYLRIKDRIVYESLLRVLLPYFEGQAQAILLNSILVGDFQEIQDIIGVLSSPKFQMHGIEMDWRAMVPDPYEYPDNYPHDSPSQVLPVYQLYDEYIGSKWFCGLDGSGRLSKENIIWLSSNASAKSPLVIGALRRLDYQDDSAEMIKLYYRLCLSVLACSMPGGVAAIKISLPVNGALLGIYSLFSIFFPQTRIVKFKQFNPDDNTVFLIGIGNAEVPLEFFPMALESDDSMNAILYNLSQNSQYPHSDLNRVIGQDILNWINVIRDEWEFRNI